MKDRLSRGSNQLEEVEGEILTYNFGIIPGIPAPVILDGKYSDG
jgi:hypothetical protein